MAKDDGVEIINSDDNEVEMSEADFWQVEGISTPPARPQTSLMPIPLTQTVDETEDEDDCVDWRLVEAEERLEKAQYYRQLVNEPLFDDPPNPDIAAEVEQEISSFVRGRMAELVGLLSPGGSSAVINNGFSPTEMERLKQLATHEVHTALVTMANRILTKPVVVRATENSNPAPPPAIQIQKRGRGRPSKTKSKTAPQVSQKPTEPRNVSLPDGSTGRLTLQGQTQPVGVQPLPPPSRAMLEAQYLAAAANQVDSLQKETKALGSMMSNLS